MRDDYTTDNNLVEQIFVNFIIVETQMIVVQDL